MKKILLIAALCALGICAQAQEKRYEVKSGIVTMEMDMMGRKVVQEIYFDDYGTKQATMSEMTGCFRQWRLLRFPPTSVSLR